MGAFRIVLIRGNAQKQRGGDVRRTYFKLVLVAVFALATSGSSGAVSSTVSNGSSPAFKHIGKLAFGPEGVLFVAAGQGGSITALQLAKQVAAGGRGTKDVPAIDQK